MWRLRDVQNRVRSLFPSSDPATHRVGGEGGGVHCPRLLPGTARGRGEKAPGTARTKPARATPRDWPPRLWSHPPSPAPQAATNVRHRSRPRHSRAGQWRRRSAARGSFAAKRIWRVKVARTLQAAAARGGAGSSPRRGLPSWARAAAAACLPGHAGRERHGRSPRGRSARAGAGGPARGGRAAAARLLADRHHLHRARCRRPTAPRRPRRATRWPSRS